MQQRQRWDQRGNQHPLCEHGIRWEAASLSLTPWWGDHLERKSKGTKSDQDIRKIVIGLLFKTDWIHFPLCLLEQECTKLKGAYLFYWLISVLKSLQGWHNLSHLVCWLMWTRRPERLYMPLCWWRPLFTLLLFKQNKICTDTSDIADRAIALFIAAQFHSSKTRLQFGFVFFW